MPFVGLAAWLSIGKIPLAIDFALQHCFHTGVQLLLVAYCVPGVGAHYEALPPDVAWLYSDYP